ncbi:MAG: FHA domain-containing protein [Pseudanabaenaceae cyanobacterium]
MSEKTATHILVINDTKGVRRIVLDSLKYTIGRDESNDIQIFSRFVSRHHAVMLRVRGEDGRFIYRILDGDMTGKASVNGVIINNKEKISSYDLVAGDRITLAPNAEMQYLVE